jgi:RimJ/RimL family protein N-acetyltransferase
MTTTTNDYGQPIGTPVPDWTPPAPPTPQVVEGRLCELRPLSVTAADALFDAFALDEDNRDWTYLPYGPFASRGAFQDWVLTTSESDRLVPFTVHSGNGRPPTGIAAYLNVVPAGGSIEVGHLRFSKLLQRTPAATEAMYLMMKRAFELGYRRYEWKCDALNAPSRRAALRLGFRFEGIFRQATVYKGRTRDTAWFSVIDAEWPDRRAAFERWLDPSNFDEDGRQRVALGDIVANR